MFAAITCVFSPPLPLFASRPPQTHDRHWRRGRTWPAGSIARIRVRMEHHRLRYVSSHIHLALNFTHTRLPQTPSHVGPGTATGGPLSLAASTLLAEHPCTSPVEPLPSLSGDVTLLLNPCNSCLFFYFLALQYILGQASWVRDGTISVQAS